MPEELMLPGVGLPLFGGHEKQLVRQVVRMCRARVMNASSASDLRTTRRHHTMRVCAQSGLRLG